MEKTASLRRLIRLLSNYSPEERAFVKDIIRLSKGKQDRFRTMMALRRAVKPETWKSDGQHRLTSVLREHYRRGDPQIFRGAHNPKEPLHLTGNKITLPISALQGPNFYSGMSHLRHVTPFPNTALEYTGNRGVVLRTKPGRYSSLTSYSASEFPEIMRNNPIDNFTRDFLGISNAVYRENPKSLGKLELKHMRDMEERLKLHPRKKLFKDRIDELREDWLDDISSGGFGGLREASPAERRRALAHRFWRLRLRNLKDSGPLDQLHDNTVKDFVLNTRKNGLRNRFRDDSGRNEYQDLYEMAVSFRGKTPKNLLMIDQKVPGQYYDVSGLSRMYERATSSGNSRMADAVKGLFKNRFGHEVE